ncbi:MAG: Gfo/Idh/MocA family oxidoreductase [Phycisphaerales bacterium]|nr:Gfo/Idh/MocA family oxidoreductase [Planctomycetota bacterium]MCH8508314.1 Gfo/Idh/MocA family oxidoreductase [Phycisphaerales bacterium]
MTDIDRRQFLAHAAGTAAAFAIVPNLAARPAGVFNASNTLRVGVIGVGRQGRAVLGELGSLSGVAVTAMCDTDERRLSAGLRRVAGAQSYPTIDAMLASNAVDAVVVATPTHMHKDAALAAMAAGKHVYCECPLAHTRADCAAISQAARGANVVAAAGFQGRANPVYQLARTFYRSDSVRDMVTMRAQNNNKTSWVVPVADRATHKIHNWRLDPDVSLGLAGELGAQQFDVFHWYTERYPVRVIGRGSLRAHREDGREVHDTINCMLEYDDGAILQYSATIGNSYEGAHEVFYGTNAAIKLAWSHGWMFKESDAPTQGWEVYANRQQFHNDEGITLIAGATQLAEQGNLQDGVGLPYTSLHYALEDWINAIGSGGTPACTIGEAARATAVGIAANQAVREARPVDVDLTGL